MVACLSGDEATYMPNVTHVKINTFTNSVDLRIHSEKIIKGDAEILD